MTETTRNSKPKQAAKPIAAHPMFPAVTALWFATFFGLGSFALAPSLLEGPVVALGIAEIFPPARPPLGFTVRALTALVMFALGGMTGLMAGRMLARGKVQAPVRNRAVGKAGMRKAAAFSAHEEAHRPDGFDSLGTDAPAARSDGSHRRPLNPREDLDLVDMPAGPFAAPAAETTAADDALVLDDSHVAPMAARDDTAPAFTVDDLLPWERDAQTLQNANRPEVPQQQSLKADPLDMDALMHAAQADAAEAYAAPAAPSWMAEPVPQAPVAMPLAAASARVEDDMRRAAAAEPSPAGPAAAPLIAKPLFQAPADAATPIARAPLEKLGLVQLTERLALAIAKARQRPAAAAQAEPASAPALAEVPSHGLDDAGAHAGMAAAPVAPVAAPAQPEAFAPVQPEAPAHPAFTIAAPTAQPAAAIARLPGLAGGLTSFAGAQSEPAHAGDERVVPLRPAAMQPLSFADDLPDAEEDDALPGLDRFLRAPEGAAQAFSPLSVKPAKLREAAAAAADAPGEPAPAPGEGQEWDTGTAEPDVAEDRYPSLLDVGLASLRHKTTAMLAAEGDDEADDRADEKAGEPAEPVVVFPGEEADAEAPLSQAGMSGPGAARPFERPSILPVQGSPLAAPGKAAPASPLDPLMSQPVDPFADHAVPAPASLQPDPEEADRALRAALATLQRMTAQG